MSAFSIEDLSTSIGIDLMKDTSFVANLLQSALTKRNRHQLVFALDLVQRTVLAATWTKTLALLLLEDWHSSHREIAFCLQQNNDPGLTETIFRAAQLFIARRGLKGESQDFLRQCLWNLYDIGTAEAQEKMLQIVQIGDQETQETYEELLAAFGTEKHQQWRTRPRCLRPEFLQN